MADGRKEKLADRLDLPGCSNRSSNEAADEAEPEAYSLEYVEDFDEPRTKLGTCFSSLG
jgi:hypothetical protein